MKSFQELLSSDNVYTVENAYDALLQYCLFIGTVKVSVKRKKSLDEYYVYNVPCAFDIEVTSFKTKSGEKCGTMYIWMFGINGIVIIGRTWKEFLELLKILQEFFGLGANVRLYCYVHNLAYEYQFIRRWLNWLSVFCIEERTPVKALCSMGIEFRCSYILSGYNLEKVGELLTKYKVKKMVGYLDYNKIRNSHTPITDKELQYCVNDVKVVMAYIQEKIEQSGNITKILLTKTSYVRKYVRDNTIYNSDQKSAFKYKQLINSLTIEPEEYESAHRAFQGGFTHANASKVDRIHKNVDSIDFTSCYPFSMLLPLYPMSKGKHISHVDKGEERKYMNLTTVSIFDVKISGLKRKPNAPDDIISLSKCYRDFTFKKLYDEDLAIVNNGRITMAFDDVYTTVTSIDWENIKQFYYFDDYEICNLWYYKCTYLPKEFIDCILHFYKLKTMLKGVEGMEEEYQWAKENLNALYGMLVTNIIRNNIAYDDGEEWAKTAPEEDEKQFIIDSYNTSQSRFMSYIWGVFTTAIARNNLYTGLLEFGDDYLYSDTDSLKVLNFDKHMQYFNNYNNQVRRKLERLCDRYNIDKALVEPKGKLIGVWDWETKDDPYIYFKTLGCKRYITLQEHKGLKMTVAGLPERSPVLDENGRYVKCVDLLNAKYKGTTEEGAPMIFDKFKMDFEISPEEVSKHQHTYIDEPMKGVLVDYLGNAAEYEERSCIHMENIGFNFDRSESYLDFLLNGMRGNEYDGFF